MNLDTLDFETDEETPGTNLEFQQIADPKELSWLEKIHASLDNLLDSAQSFHVEIPKSMQIFGRVSVDKIDELPPVKVNNLSELNNPLVAIAHGINDLQKATVGAIKEQKISVPKDLSVTNEVKIADFADLLDGIEELKKGFNLLLNKEAATVGFPSSTIPVEIQNWMIPQPVTNVSINPNRGTVKASAVTVTATAAPLPATALADRRSMTIYNNGAVTIYVGGSTVTSTTGIPVGAGLWGPSLDVGPLNLLYAITASGTSDVRVLEMNDIVAGGDN